MAAPSAGEAPGDIVVMGQLLLPYGVHGWLRIRPYTAEPETLLGFASWWLRPAAGGPWRAAVPHGGRLHGDVLLVQLEGVGSREAALALKGSEVGVARGELPGVAAGEIYQADLVGLDVVNRAGVVLGRVVEVADFGAHPLLRVVRSGPAAAQEERLIPYVAAVVDAVDVPERRIVVDWGEDF